MNQDLMFFEAAAIAAESAKCEAQRAAEQHEREAKAAAKVLLQAAREKIKQEKHLKTEDWRRRTAQARTYKTPRRTRHVRHPLVLPQPERYSYWHNYHACGQPLIYTSDPNATPQICPATTT